MKLLLTSDRSLTGIGRRTNANPLFLGVRGGIAGLVGFAMDF
jgi:hypothetical protein